MSLNANRSLDMSNTGTIAVAAGNSAAILGVIFDTSNLTIAGGGQTHARRGEHLFGGTYVSAGTLAAGVISVANTSGAFGNNSAVTLANAAGVVLNITGFNTQIGSLTGGGPLGGNVTLGAATLTVGGDGTGPAAYAGVISGAGGLTKVGVGTLTLSGANTYGGATTLSFGGLDLQNQYAIQKSTLTMIGSVNCNLVFDSSVAANAFTLGGLAAASNGTGYDISLQNSAGTAIALSVGNNNASTVYAGVLSGSGSLTKIGNGTLTLSASNIYTGGTTVSSGQLNVNSNMALGTGILTMAGGNLDNTSTGAITYANNIARTGTATSPSSAPTA